MFGLVVPVVSVVRRARPFGRNHQRAERMCRRATSPKGWTSDRLEASLQDQTRLTLSRLNHFLICDAKLPPCIKGCISICERETASRDFSEASPFSRDNPEYLTCQQLRGTISILSYGANVLILHFSAAGLELPDAH